MMSVIALMNNVGDLLSNTTMSLIRVSGPPHIILLESTFTFFLYTPLKKAFEMSSQCRPRSG